MSDETTRLRALLKGIALPWRVGRRGMAMQWSAPDRIGQLVERHEIDSVDVTEPNNAALIVAAVNALPGLLDAAERAERAERERDDLAATLETRTAEHALAMARVAELEAIIAGRTTPPTDEEAAAMKAAGLRLARRWHAVDKAGTVRPFPTAEVFR